MYLCTYYVIKWEISHLITLLWCVALQRVGKVIDGTLVAVDLLAQEVHLIDWRWLCHRVQEIVVHLLNRIDLWPPEEINKYPKLLTVHIKVCGICMRYYYWYFSFFFI